MNNMRIVLTAIFISLTFFISETVCAQQNDKQLTSRLKSLARENLNNTTKRLCLAHFTDTSAVQVLAPFATVSQMCECVIAETSFVVSNDLAQALLMAQINHKEHKNSENTPLPEAFVNYTQKYNVAWHSCIEEVIRRRR